jgi:nucleoside-diphosphate-sugar epimerase
VKSLVLVTGGTGFIGKVAVRRLIQDGYRVRVLARTSANVEPIVSSGAEIAWGDVSDPVSFGTAVSGCRYVVHLAAGTSGSRNDSETATLSGTRTLLDLCRQHKPERLVYVSSCGVYGLADYERNSVVSETSPLERSPERRGFYSAAKLAAETCVREYMKTGDVPVVILRPGAVYGPGSDLFTGAMGFAVGPLRIVIGTGDLILPLVYIDNLAEAIALCLQRSDAAGEIFNVVDPEKITKRQYVDRVLRRIDSRAHFLYVPYSIVYTLTWMQELAFKLTGHPPLLSCYRLASSQKKVIFDGTKIARHLSWTPTFTLNDAVAQLVTRPSGHTKATHASDKEPFSVGLETRR